VDPKYICCIGGQQAVDVIQNCPHAAVETGEGIDFRGSMNTKFLPSYLIGTLFHVFNVAKR
jgi:hypothetical protein